MNQDDERVRLLARALYEIRHLLGGFLGSESTADVAVKEAAHLSYALHNEALAVTEGREFDLSDAIAKIKAIERIIPGTETASRILENR